ncbi:class A beta-lactamase [Ascidiaceihabitans sp.]|uniref:class A beta-lactamase n=1 Tax=Ascidiaceihabitans sp. TaxID=1872644 RepID=UPI003298E50C
MTTANIVSLLRCLFNKVLWAAFAFTYPLVSQVQAQTVPDPAMVARTVATLEKTLDARVGVYLFDSGTGWQWGHRETERFLMASTFKPLLCGAILAQADAGALSLEDRIDVRKQDMVPYAPVTETHVGHSMSIHDLCFATLDLSDNTAANLLTNRLGGPQNVTAFLQAIGDDVTRLDRLEPDVNTFVPNDPRDTTSPIAMTRSWATLLLGDALQPKSAMQLAAWLSHGGVTGQFIRAHAPQGWQVLDKSGGGRHHTRNLMAMVTPPGEPPVLVAIFVSDTPADWDTRNAAVSTLGAAVIEILLAR